MPYEILSQEEQDDIIMSFLLSQERDEYCHQLNLTRYEQMLTVLPDGPWKQTITKYRDETNQRLAEVRSIIAATQAQLPPADRKQAAITRVRAKQTPTA